MGTTPGDPGQHGTVNNSDASLLHQVTRLQTEKQEWLARQREFELRIKVG